MTTVAQAVSVYRPGGGLRCHVLDARRGARIEIMDYGHLGNSGLKISEITYGTWLTHGSQEGTTSPTQCVRVALEVGTTTFDTTDADANTGAETVLGEASKGERQASAKISTKVYWPIGPQGPNDVGLSRKAHRGVDRRVARTPADRLRGPPPRTATTTERPPSSAAHARKLGGYIDACGGAQAVLKALGNAGPGSAASSLPRTPSNRNAVGETRSAYSEPPEGHPTVVPN